MPNMVAYGALAVWPIITIIIFTQLSTPRAIIWSLLLGYMFLPAGTLFNPPLLPDLDKTTIPSLSTLVCAVLFGRGAIRWPRSPLVLTLMVLFVLSPFFTAYGNREPLILASYAMPALTSYDGLTGAGYNAIALIPLVLGYSALADEKNHFELLRALVIAVLAYSILALFEVRFSPILQPRLYGVTGGNFSMSIRFGGFRPSVFLGTGLYLATFFAMGTVAAVALWKLKARVFSIPAGLTLTYLMIVLILIKSLGSIVLTIFTLPLITFLRPRTAIAIMACGAAAMLAYPALRAFDLAPTQMLSSMAGMVNAERRESLDFRFNNEAKLLERAERKPLFGWGGYGRNKVYGTSSMNTTVEDTVTDGTWIIVIGQSGWVGYIALFGLLLYPFWLAFRRRRFAFNAVPIGLLTLHFINMVDLIPNSSLKPITWLIAGSLYGLAAVKNFRRHLRKEKGGARPSFFESVPACAPVGRAANG